MRVTPTKRILRFATFGGCVAVAALTALGGFFSPTVAADNEYGQRQTKLPAGSIFGQRLAGLYFVTEATTGARHLISFWADGNLQSISSEQEGGTPVFNPFSDQVGTWKRTGHREITAKAIDITYNRDPMTTFGFGVARYVLKFDRDFRTVNGSLVGGVIGPEDHPGNMDAEFLFTFATPLQGNRIPIRFPDGFPNH